MTSFADFGLPGPLVDVLKSINLITPTPVQKETIPLALAGHDILASAQTGTGKTAAYLLPLIVNLLKNQHSSALILAPTRELAMQVHVNLKKILGNAYHFKTALLIGGAPMPKQIMDLRRKPQLIVGTPGRITDHLLRGTLKLNNTGFLVIDEADRMLDMGFEIQLNQIAEYLPETKQTLMFSATLPPNVDRLTKKYLNNPQKVAIDVKVMTAPKIKQEIERLSEGEKWPKLLEQLNEREGSVIIFVRTKRRADAMASDLRDEDHFAEAMHGDLPQRRRERVIQAFRNSKCRIIVATDVAARGLDIPHVMHVINYDLPECPEDYVHRIGRTGRAEAEGFALSFISPQEGGKWKAISRLINPEEQSKDRFSEKSEDGRKSFSREKKGWNRNESSRPPRRNQKRFGGDKERSFTNEDGFKKQDGFKRNDGFRKADGFKKQDGFRKSEGFKRNDGFKKQDGFRKQEGFKKSEDFNRQDGFKKQDGFRKADGFRKSEDFNRQDGFKKKEGFKKQDGFKKSDEMNVKSFDKPFKNKGFKKNDRPFKRSSSFNKA